MRRPLVIALVVTVVVVIAAVVGGILIAQAVARGAALSDYRAADDALRVVLTDSGATTGEADEVLALGDDPLLPPAEIAALVEGQDAADATAAEIDTALAVDVEVLETEAIVDATADLRDLASTLTADVAEVDAALDALGGTVAANAPTVEEASFDANNAPRIAYRAAADALDDVADDQLAEAIAAYLDAARSLAASHAAELDEKAGPLLDARLAVQQFARSMSGGVMLEFDWAPTVNGYGYGGSYGGTSYWKTADGGQATVTLSDSVAAQWPGAGVQALVVHEVGHAILARHDCNILFFESDLYPGEEESWATAWAIGLGYTADGSGESVYGRPSDALIDLSTGCR